MLSRGAVSSPHCGRLLRAAVPLGRWRRPHDRRVPERRAHQTHARDCLQPSGRLIAGRDDAGGDLEAKMKDNHLVLQGKIQDLRTADEVEFTSEDEVVIRESKNTTQGVLPSMSDIKDGLFKLLLYSQLSELHYENRRLRFAAQIRLTGKFSDELSLPAQESRLQDFLSQFSSSRQRKSIVRKLTWLNRELELLGIQAILRGNAVSAGGAL